jgi:hypothetical protein
MWNRVLVSLWWALVAIPMLLDVYIDLTKRPDLPTLTGVIVREVPWFIALATWLWLGIHFGSRYMGRPIL